MIVVKVNGGLGNQMFQYAIGRSLTIKKGNGLVLDNGSMTEKKKNYTTRDFELSIFGLEKYISKNPYSSFVTSKSNSIQNLINRIKIKLLNINFYYEGSLKFDNAVFSVPNNTYLEGYFQCEKYFLDVRKQLLIDFNFPSGLSKENEILVDLIKNKNAVSIHIRRGDYVNNAHINSVHGVLSKSYYDNAIEFFLKNSSFPYFFIFSDDPEWVKTNFIIDAPSEIISHNTGDLSYIDMHLMSLCKHNIIANSSFSWWGAWLNQFPNKIVVAPKNWFNDNKKQQNDIVCDSWIEIE